MIEVIRKKVLGKTDISKDLKDSELLALIDETISEEGIHTRIPLSVREELRKNVYNSIRGLDILEKLLADEDITEIMVNSENSVFIEKSGRLMRYNGSFSGIGKLEDVIQRIAAQTNKRINESSPIADTALKDGSRVNIVMSPVSLGSSVITIRKFGSHRLTMEKLCQLSSLDKSAADLLRELVISGFNIFVCGGTGSGKTTFLNALSQYIPKDERIITIEDSPELNIDIENLVRLVARCANTEGRGEISIRELIRTALRMRPTRIIVGEVRGPEAIDMLQAMNTGHDGSLSTGHGNSVPDMLSRLETMVLMGMNIPLEAVKSMIASSIDIIIHLGRLHDKTRRVLEISELAGMENGSYVINTLCRRTFKGDSSFLQYSGNHLINTVKLETSNSLDTVNHIIENAFKQTAFTAEKGDYEKT